MDFSVSKKITNDYDFYVNSNYFDKSRHPLCGVIINGKVEKKIVNNRGGAFIVKNGKADIVFDPTNEVEYLSQTHIWLIKEGKINDKVLNQSHAKKKTSRLLIGKNRNQDIIVIHSNKSNFITMRELTTFALKQGITDAINLDSGPSVEVFLRDGNYKYEMKSSPNKHPLKNPVIYIAGKFN
jgi:exopolysaccharide biosynthesis protein